MFVLYELVTVRMTHNNDYSVWLLDESSICSTVEIYQGTPKYTTRKTLTQDTAIRPSASLGTPKYNSASTVKGGKNRWLYKYI